MSEEFDRIQADLRDFNKSIKRWNLDEIDEEEADQIADLMQETMLLLGEIGQGDTGYEEDN